MDKVIEKKKGIAAAFTKKSVKWWALGAFVILVVVLLLTGRRSVLKDESLVGDIVATASGD